MIAFTIVSASSKGNALTYAFAFAFTFTFASDFAVALDFLKATFTPNSVFDYSHPQERTWLSLLPCCSDEQRICPVSALPWHCTEYGTDNHQSTSISQ